MTYNVAGNGTVDWSTNSLQVQAIGREVGYLQPDIITFNEIPYTNTWQMANFIAAYLPGYFLATNSATDGYIRNAIASRFAIVRSKSWLHSSSLAAYGYTNGTFTRDLFEAEISVPNFSEHLHVFVAHLKAFSDAPSAARRAAEASAISNFLVATFLPIHGDRPYLLAGDLNEDIDQPPVTSGHPIQRLANRATGLELTTPLDPATGNDRTYSSRGTGLLDRIDYVLPGGLLFSNIASSEVFRTDRLNPLPSGLFTNDSATASDHLPLLMVFTNPFDLLLRVTAIYISNEEVRLSWPSSPGRQYALEGSSDLLSWGALSTNVTATTSNINQSLTLTTNRQFWRVHLLP